MPDASDTRLIELEGAFNFRDLGGYPAGPGRRTRWRRLFRSDSLSELTPGDLATLESLGVATVVDLRTSAEVDRDGRAGLDPRRVHYAHLSVLREEAGESAGAPAATSRPSAICGTCRTTRRRWCGPSSWSATRLGFPWSSTAAAGKDRTGVLAALVLSLVGVDRDVVVADYALTAERMPLIVERLRRHPVYGPRMAEMPSATFGVRAETMARFLDGLDDRYGGPGGWAAQAGLDPSVVAALDALLVEEGPDDREGPTIK